MCGLEIEEKAESAHFKWSLSLSPGAVRKLNDLNGRNLNKMEVMGLQLFKPFVMSFMLRARVIKELKCACVR